MLKAIYRTFHHHKLLSVFLLYQMPTKVVQAFQIESWWHEKGSVEYIYIEKRKIKECQINTTLKKIQIKSSITKYAI